jgi:hypothetical protein
MREDVSTEFRNTANSTPEPVRDRSGWVPRRATLDGFVAELSRLETGGVLLTTLAPLTTLTVTTYNSTYRFVVRDRTTVLVKGGHFFPEFTEARLAGSGFGGSMLKLDWIIVGLRMEIWSDGRPIITSPVRLIATEPETVGSALCQ